MVWVSQSSWFSVSWRTIPPCSFGECSAGWTRLGTQFAPTSVPILHPLFTTNQLTALCSLQGDLAFRLFGNWARMVCTILQSFQFFLNVALCIVANGQGLAQMAVGKNGNGFLCCSSTPSSNIPESLTDLLR